MTSDCGIRAIAAVTGWDYSDTRRYVIRAVGASKLTGKDMRVVMTELGWQWINSGEAVIIDTALVVGRRGFAAVVDGRVHDIEAMKRIGRICGYYRRQD